MTDASSLSQPGPCHCGSPTCTGRCPECNMHETQKYGHNVHYGPTAEELERELLVDNSAEAWEEDWDASPQLGGMGDELRQTYGE